MVRRMALGIVCVGVVGGILYGSYSLVSFMKVRSSESRFVAKIRDSNLDSSSSGGKTLIKDYDTDTVSGDKLLTDSLDSFVTSYSRVMGVELVRYSVEESVVDSAFGMATTDYLYNGGSLRIKVGAFGEVVGLVFYDNLCGKEIGRYLDGCKIEEDSSNTYVIGIISI